MAYDVQDVQNDVVELSRILPVVVDFWAEWCGPCRILGPTLEKLAQEEARRPDGERWRLAKVDTEVFQDEAARYGIRGIPNVKLFVDGEPVDEFVGPFPSHRSGRGWSGRSPPQRTGPWMTKVPGRPAWRSSDAWVPSIP